MENVTLLTIQKIKAFVAQIWLFIVELSFCAYASSFDMG